MKRIFTIFMLALPFIVFSQTGKYLEFNGTDQYMQIPTHADFNVQTSESFTITAWVNVIEFKNNNARYITKRLQGTTVADKSGYELWGANSAAQYYALNTPMHLTTTTIHFRYGQPTPVHSTNGRTLLLWWIAREEKCMSTSMV